MSFGRRGESSRWAVLPVTVLSVMSFCASVTFLVFLVEASLWVLLCLNLLSDMDINSAS